MSIIENTNSNIKYYSYKQGFWFRKSDDKEEKYYDTKSFEDRDGVSKEVSGIFVNGLQGIVSYVGVNDLDINGNKFSVLEVILDGNEKLSIGINSEASKQVTQTFENLDFSKKVNLIAWTKDGWSKLSIKQDDEHVKNSFFEFKDNMFKSIDGTNYPIRPDKDAPKRDKDMFKIDEEDFIRKHIENVIKPLVPEYKETVSDYDVYENEGGTINEENQPSEEINTYSNGMSNEEDDIISGE